MGKESQGAQVPKQEQTVRQGRPCPQDCGKCGPWQQMFCCTKMVFDLSRNLQVARQEVAQLKDEIAELRKSMPMTTLELSNPEIDHTAQ